MVAGTGVAVGGLRGGRGGGLRTRRVHLDHAWGGRVPGVDTGRVAGRSGGLGDTRDRTSVGRTERRDGSCSDRDSSGDGESGARAGGDRGQPGR